MLYELETRWRVSLLQYPGLCELFPVFFLTTQYLSPLLVLGFTVERYIGVQYPLRAATLCTVERARYSDATMLVEIRIRLPKIPKFVGMPIRT